MDKQQAAEKIANTLLNGKCDTRLFSYIEEGAIAGWEAHETKYSTDAAELKTAIEKILTEEIAYAPQVQGFVVHGAIEKLLALFNPSGVAKQFNEPICSCGGGENNGHDWNCPWQEQEDEQMPAHQADPFIEKHLTRIKELQAHYATIAPQAVGPVWVKASERVPAEGTICPIKYLHGKIRVVDAKYWGIMNNAHLWIENRDSRPQTYTAIEWLDESGQQVFTLEQVKGIAGAWSAELIGSYEFPLSEAQELSKRFTEFFDTNYPETK